MTKHRVTAPSGLNVRTMRTATGNTPIGTLADGTIVEVSETVGGWHTVGPITFQVPRTPAHVAKV